MSVKKTLFNRQWLDAQLNQEFVPWLSDVKGNIHQAFCKSCSKKIELSNMGRQAIISHAKGPIHIKNMTAKFCQPSVSTLFINQHPTVPLSSSTDDFGLASTTEERQPPSESRQECSTLSSRKQDLMGTYILKDDTKRAEIIWALNVVSKRMSFNSCSKIGELFQQMFPDSSIAKQFSMGSTKVAYTITHGLAPHFRDLLLHQLKSCDIFVICFDESLNKVVQRGQMDQIVRFWDENKQKVSTRYWNSVFMGKATANDLLEKFCEGLSPLPLSKLLQTSMDGPNVNHSFHKKLGERFANENENSQLLDLGTCGLHVVHGAVKTGFNATGWDIHSVIRHMYYLFKDTPARRADYIALTGSHSFPLKFCAIRWVENVICAERAIKVFDDVKKYVQQAQLPNSKSAASVKKALLDPLMKCKLAFFKTITSECEPFLRRFQSTKPLVPFLHGELHQLLHVLMSRCIKKEKIEASNTIMKLMALDLKSTENLRDRNDINIGFAARKLLKEVKASEREKGDYLLECRKALTVLIEKFKERSPLKFKVVRALSSLDPKIITQKPSLAQQRMKVLLETLHDANRINESTAEKANSQYLSLCQAAKDEFVENFNGYQEQTGLDTFYANMLANNPTYIELFHVIKFCLILSHGNASVESGFSINKSLLIENMLEETIIRQRIVHDAIAELGNSVLIDKKLMQSVTSARKSYQHYLDAQQKTLLAEAKTKGEKRKITEQIKHLDEEKKRIRKEADIEEQALDLKIKQLQNQKNTM